MNVKLDNILNCTEEIIAHQVNCQNVMGSGVAKVLYTKYNDVKARYHMYNEHNDKEKLLGSTHIFRAFNKNHSESIIIANCYSQYNYGSTGEQFTDYEAVKKCFESLAKQVNGKVVAVPYGYGAGLGGGDWEIIARIICKALDNNVTFYKIDGYDEKNLVK
jgi:O-acetyl-ADP-ribose deacetylase (regulator of RNase III)